MQSQSQKNKDYCAELRRFIQLHLDVAGIYMKDAFKHRHESQERERLYELAALQRGKVDGLRQALDLFIEMNKGAF